MAGFSALGSVDAVSREDLNKVRSGDVISARLFNAVIEYVRSTQVPPKKGAFQDAAGEAYSTDVRDRSMWVRCVSSVSAPPWSIVEVYDGTLDDDGIVVKVRQATSTAAMWAGNENYDLVSGANGWVKLITPYEPVKVLLTGAAPSWMGDLTTSGTTVTSGGGSMIMLGSPDSAGRVSVLGHPSNSSCDTVRFQIISSDALSQTALAEILARPNGCGVSDIPATSLGGTVVELCDPSGCYLTENPNDLIGRQGWARYMFPASQGVSACQPNFNYIVPEWEIFALCTLNCGV